MILKPSRRLAVVLVVAHAAAATTLFPLAFPTWAKVVIALLITASLVHSLRRHASLRSRASVTAIELHNDDRATFETANGMRHAARVLGTTYVTPQLCVMNLRVEGRLLARHAVIVADNIDAEDFRRLRVQLRWGYRQEADQALSVRSR